MFPSWVCRWTSFLFKANLSPSFGAGFSPEADLVRFCSFIVFFVFLTYTPFPDESVIYMISYTYIGEKFTFTKIHNYFPIFLIINDH